MNVYAFVVGDPVNKIDAKGLEWYLDKRETGERRTRVCSDSRSDTLSQLASKANLSTSDALGERGWLRTADGQGSVSTYLPMTRYSIPNVFVIGGGEGGIANSILALWQVRLSDALEENGFTVELYRHDIGHRSQDFVMAANSKDVWGYALFGHGYKAISSWFTPWVPDPTMMTIYGALEWEELDLITAFQIGRNFKYGLGINYHCYADKHPWDRLAIKYYGATGTLSALSGPRGIGYWGSWKGLVESALGP